MSDLKSTIKNSFECDLDQGQSSAPSISASTKEIYTYTVHLQSAPDMPFAKDRGSNSRRNIHISQGA